MISPPAPHCSRPLQSCRESLQVFVVLSALRNAMLIETQIVSDYERAQIKKHLLNMTGSDNNEESHGSNLDNVAKLL